uniref:Molybdopterin synthase catalytic subunit n=1 Tax=Aureoumbra lagunensis TaxID=44058 RepID=A0A7S3NLF5_9STRA
MCPDLIRLDNKPLSNDEAVTFVGDPGCGAISTFLGTTRNNFQGKKVATLSYEAYGGMAEKEMQKLANRAREQFAISKCVILHRIGEVPVGDISVIIAVSAPHRRAALDACSWLIDELKANVPIWKKESYHDSDDPIWKQNTEFASRRGEDSSSRTTASLQE